MQYLCSDFPYLFGKLKCHYSQQVDIHLSKQHIQQEKNLSKMDLMIFTHTRRDSIYQNIMEQFRLFIQKCLTLIKKRSKYSFCGSPRSKLHTVFFKKEKWWNHLKICRISGTDDVRINFEISGLIYSTMHFRFTYCSISYDLFPTIICNSTTLLNVRLCVQHSVNNNFLNRKEKSKLCWSN